MGHSISGFIVPGGFDREQAEIFGLQSVALENSHLTLLFCDIHLSERWREQLDITGQLTTPPVSDLLVPVDRVIVEVLRRITGQREPLFIAFATDYFGGAGGQVAFVFQGEQVVSPADETTINMALARLGVVPLTGKDAFDTVGLGRYRSMPEIDE